MVERTNNIKSVEPTKVPDHNNSMTKVRMVSYSMPSPEFAREGLNDVQDLIAFCARVSNPSNQFNKENRKSSV